MCRILWRIECYIIYKWSTLFRIVFAVTHWKSVISTVMTIKLFRNKFDSLRLVYHSILREIIYISIYLVYLYTITLNCGKYLNMGNINVPKKISQSFLLHIINLPFFSIPPHSIWYFSRKISKVAPILD
jgi:hypothetical protein